MSTKEKTKSIQLIEFRNICFVAQKIVAVSEIQYISTGPLSCDWEYGFVVMCEGKDIEMPIKTPTDRNGNHIDGLEKRWQLANNERVLFLNLIELYYDELN